jgi:hypothetical protein
VIELRIIHKDRRVTSGFYDVDHIDMLTQEAMAVTQSAGVKGCYMTMNPLAAHVLDRPGSRNQTRRARRGDGAQKADVARRHWLLIDADPIRPTKGSATDAEKAAALTAVLEVRDFLTGRGWPSPVLCDSGNGWPQRRAAHMNGPARGRRGQTMAPKRRVRATTAASRSWSPAVCWPPPHKCARALRAPTGPPGTLQAYGRLRVTYRFDVPVF